MYTLWTLQLPLQVRSHVADMEFNATTYKEVFQKADKVFLSTKTTEINPTVAAIAAKPAEAETSSGEAQVAATQMRNRRGGGRNKGNNTNKPNNNNRNGGEGKPRGPRHHSNPPSSCCDNHFRWGSDSWFCLAPTSCPWKDKVTERPSGSGSAKNKNNK